MTRGFLTPKKAYAILKTHFPEKVVKGCVEFSTFYGFYMVAQELENEELITGRFVDAVDKKSGRIFSYDIFGDMNAYRNARNINVRMFK